MAGWANSGGVMYDPNEIYGANYRDKFDTVGPSIERIGDGRGTAYASSNDPIGLMETNINKELTAMPTGGYMQNITLPPAPQLNLAQYNQGRVRNIQQQIASPALSRNSRAVQRALAYARARGGSPAAMQAVREALAGSGEAEGSIMSSAGSSARGQYGQELALENQGITNQWQADTNRSNLQAQIDMQNRQAQENYRLKLLDRLNAIGLLRQNYLTGQETKKAANSSIGSFGAVAQSERDRQNQFMTDNPSGYPKVNYGTTPSAPATKTGNDWGSIVTEFNSRIGQSVSTGFEDRTTPKVNPNDVYKREAGLTYPEATNTSEIPLAISHAPYNNGRDILDMQKLRGISTLGGA